MTVREYAEIFSDMLHCTECYRCKANGILCHNISYPKINIEPWRNYPNIYNKLNCTYNSPGKCKDCALNNQGICKSCTVNNRRLYDQEIERFLQTATGEVEIYE